MSSGASRPVEPMIWISEIESAQFISELKTSKQSPGQSCRQTSRFFDSKISSGLKKIINGDF